jgi:hypothetical protein
VPPIERVQVTEETKLVELCVKEKHTLVHEGFTKSLKDCLFGMDVGDLKGYTEETLKDEVERQGGPRMLVPGWLVEHELEDYLKPTKKAKSGEGSGSGSGSSSSASPGKRTCFLFLYFGLTFCRSLSSQEPLWECHG